MNFYIDVILPLAVPNTFTYQVSKEAFERIQNGFRVSVPFGKRGIYTALVVKKHQVAPLQYEAKDIYEVLDIQPVVTEKQLQLWHWIAEYYMCTLGEVYRAAIPSALLLESETIVIYDSSREYLTSELSDDEYLIYEAFQQQPILRISEISKIVNKKNIFPIIEELIKKEMMTLEGEIREVYKPKIQTYIRLPEAYQNQDNLQELLEILSRSEKQRTAVLSYFQLYAQDKSPITSKQLSEFSGVSSAVINGLIKKNILESYSLAQDRVIFDEASKNEVILSEPQQTAFDAIKKGWEEKEVVLLHGITGSGKTEIYINLIKEHLEEDKQILFLLPEIALTTQLVSRLTQYFGNQIAVFHSKYSVNERVEVWQNLLEKSEKAKIIVGARSSVLLPFDNLGLIIVDEEHESSYKQQDPAPRYHARDIAIVLSHLHQAKVILGSATPSLESYYNCYENKYAKVILNERFGKSKLPEIVLIDLKENHKKKQMTGHFSQALIDEMMAKLVLGEQVILFQNRRGFAPVSECLRCGHVPHCTQCDVSLTYHKNKDILKCHYCGYAIANPTHCHACQSPDITTKGFGTEQIELELKKLFPNKKIARMDQDTTRGKFAFERLIDAFNNKEINILVGTQMLAKGLDFAHVTLVGILHADQALYFPDFRAHERAFQMFMQVAGRAGRKEKKGKVMIQTYNPHHNIIRQVVENDYPAMFKEQMFDRHMFHYPPYFRLVRLQLKHADYQKLLEGSLWLSNRLLQELHIPVLGPEEPAVSRIKNQFIRVILIKIPVQTSSKSVKIHIQKILKSFDAIPNYRSIKVGINVDYY